MITIVKNKTDLKRFIYFPKELYKNDPHFVPPIYYILTKELIKEVLQTQKYTALIFTENKKVLGRLLYTTDYSKAKQTVIGYYSFFESINQLNVTKALFEHMENDLLSRNISYIEGTFTPYDPDTRRGILVQGFDKDPTIMTSYNFEYYQTLLEEIGYSKALDTFSLEAEISDATNQKMTTLENYFEKRHRVRIDSLNYKQLEQDMLDVHHILQTASTEINYQEPPSIEMIRDVAQNLKLFINPSLIKIAREEETNEPVGFCLVLPDFNQVLKKSKGRLNPFYLLFSKRYITRTRGIMQYVVPKYQNTGLIAVMFKKVYNHFRELNITEFEAGTMVEENMKAMSSFLRFGGKITKIYRLYGKELKNDL